MRIDEQLLKCTQITPGMSGRWSVSNIDQKELGTKHASKYSSRNKPGLKCLSVLHLALNRQQQAAIHAVREPECALCAGSRWLAHYSRWQWPQSEVHDFSSLTACRSTTKAAQALVVKDALLQLGICDKLQTSSQHVVLKVVYK